VEHAVHHLRKAEQRAPDYLRLNPQGLVPALELIDSATVLTQSVAICEWLDETHPEPAPLPGSALERAHIRAFALAIACDIHPVQNLKGIVTLAANGRRCHRSDRAQRHSPIWIHVSCCQIRKALARERR
jgi:maleylpyruvate isomerase